MWIQLIAGGLFVLNAAQAAKLKEQYITQLTPSRTCAPLKHELLKSRIEPTYQGKHYQKGILAVSFASKTGGSFYTVYFTPKGQWRMLIEETQLAPGHIAIQQWFKLQKGVLGTAIFTDPGLPEYPEASTRHQIKPALPQALEPTLKLAQALRASFLNADCQSQP